jgi:hypothetical protein
VGAPLALPAITFLLFVFVWVFLKIVLPKTMTLQVPLLPDQPLPPCFLFLYITLKLSISQNFLTQDNNPVGAPLALLAITSLLSVLV